jgi:hypothetical protein
VIEPNTPVPGGGPRFSNNLTAKSRSRSPSPEVLGGSKYIQYMAMPGYEAYKKTEQNPVRDSTPTRAPNENIMKIDNFISNLLKVGDDP